MLPLNEILVGDAIDQLRTLPDECVHCVIASPPYWGLRDYGAPGQIGLEKTPEEYVKRMVEVFREVRRVLRKDGSLWLNMGDSYAGSGRGGNPTRESSTLEGGKEHQEASMVRRRRNHGLHASAVNAGVIGTAWVPSPPGLKEKDLVGMPWRVAFALQDDGWWLRSDIIWAKQNTMPESVRDRPTKAHEYVFLLSKSERYFYDAGAIREPYVYGRDHHRNLDIPPVSHVPGLPIHSGLRRSGNKERKVATVGQDGRLNTHLWYGVPWEEDGRGRNKRTVWSLPAGRLDLKFCKFCKALYSIAEFLELPEREKKKICRCGRHDGWVAHFAVMPEELASICVMAGTSEGGCCSNCGTPFLPQEKRSLWKPGCPCKPVDAVPCTALDPFSGAGTTALVALKARRNFVGIELNPDYAELSRARIAQELAQSRIF